MKLNQIICMLLACTVLTGLTAFAEAAPDNTTTTKETELRIAYQPLASPGGSLMEVIKRDRLFRKELQSKGIKLSWVTTNAGGRSAKLLKDGELDAALMGDMPAIELALSTPILLIGPIKRNYASVVAQRGLTPRELKGKKIGYVYASSGHYALLKTLQNGGLTEHDVTLIQIEIDKITEALINGKIEAFAAWEPTPSLIISKYPDRFSVTGRQSSTSYLAISKKFANQHPESAYQLATALVRAIQWLGRDGTNLKMAVAWNQSTITARYGKNFSPATEELYRQLASDVQNMKHLNGPSSIADKGNRLLLDEFDFLKAIGKLPKTAQWETVRKSFDYNMMDQIHHNPTVSLINRFDYDLK